jgi:cytochrome b subunit of formate dehydrogenase
VWTGFALTYPEAFWARPLVAWENGWRVRGTIHRIAGAVFLAISALHVVLLWRSARLRAHWKDLWPRRTDVTEALTGFAYNLGLRGEKPSLDRHSYIEKAEYWAVVWGGVIMGGTGIMLWANTFVLRWLPKTGLDLATVIHFYEAVLATLAIVVWHFYFVIFDPDVYPMDTAWLSGFSPRARRKRLAEADSESQAGETTEAVEIRRERQVRT